MMCARKDEWQRGGLGGGPWLFMDAAGADVRIGCWEAEKWLAWERTAGRLAVEGLFAATDGVLERAGVRLEECAGVVFVEGPGSILGIRIAAMAVRAWRALPVLAGRPVWGVGSLALAGHLLLRADPAQRDFSLLADSRQGRWNVSVVRDGVVRDGFEEKRAEELAALPRPCFRISQRALGMPPVDCENYPAGLLEEDAGVLTVPGLLRQIEEPDAVNMPGVFAKWEPGRHRGG